MRWGMISHKKLLTWPLTTSKRLRAWASALRSWRWREIELTAKDYSKLSAHVTLKACKVANHRMSFLTRPKRAFPLKLSSRSHLLSEYPQSVHHSDKKAICGNGEISARRRRTICSKSCRPATFSSRSSDPLSPTWTSPTLRFCTTNHSSSTTSTRLCCRTFPRAMSSQPSPVTATGASKSQSWGTSTSTITSFWAPLTRSRKCWVSQKYLISNNSIKLSMSAGNLSSKLLLCFSVNTLSPFCLTCVYISTSILCAHRFSPPPKWFSKLLVTHSATKYWFIVCAFLEWNKTIT